MAPALPHSNDARTATARDEARRSVVIPIGVIVVVAIVCVIVAVMGSAQRADEVAFERERLLLTRAFVNRSEWSLRRLDALALTAGDADRLFERDVAVIQRRFEAWLKTLLDHDVIVVADAADRLIGSPVDRHSRDLRWADAAVPELQPTLDYLRGRTDLPPAGTIRLTGSAELAGPAGRAAFLQTYQGHLAIVAARVVAPADASSRPRDFDTAVFMLAVLFIDHDILSDFANRLQLKNLRTVDGNESTSGDQVFSVIDGRRQTVARFAWTSNGPGAAIVRSVIPFITIALAGFAILAGLIFGHMRRTAATIAAGESRLRYLALHDALSGLPNRIFFGEQLDVTIERIRKGSPAAAVLYIDLDHFKDVNDTLGHPIGDELLRAVTLRLHNAVQGDDLVARIGGDEFAVIMAAGPDHQTLLTIAGRLIVAICAPYTISNKTIVIGASIGIAVIHEHIGGAADIMRHADMALYRAKNEGRNRACIYDTAMDTDLLRRKLLENDLRAAIERDELGVAYQPIVNSSGETVLGVEALCRWTHPKRGEIPPSEFIPIAENSGLIIDLGEWMLRRACIDAKGWQDVFVSVNVSPLQFRRTDFFDVVERILAETGFDPKRLELEVTESTLLGNVDTAELAMSRLKSLGVRLALDDFGTGYSSLHYLRRFPFDKLKIDKSFVHSIERTSDAAAIVHAVVSLGRGLGMKVTAEGVETAEQHLFLRAAGIHSLQGYRFGRPGPASQISERLAIPGSFRLDEDMPGLAMAG